MRRLGSFECLTFGLALAACGADPQSSPSGAAGNATNAGSASVAGTAGAAGTSSASSGGGAPSSGGGGGSLPLAGQAGAPLQQGGAGAGGSSVATAGAGGSSAGQAAGGSGGAPPAGTATFVAVGYAGRRIRSIDGGMSWIDEQTLGGGGDDEFLLRGVGFGAGQFVAVGWKILSSPDGKIWTPQQNPQNQWLAGVQFGASGFVATGGYGYCAKSSDGKAWAACKSIPNNEASRSLAFGMGKFVTATDPGNWFESADGSAWSLLSGGHQGNQVAFCADTFKASAECTGSFTARDRAAIAGITIRLRDGKLERSTNGADFAPVAGSPGSLEGVAAGYVE